MSEKNNLTDEQIDEIRELIEDFVADIVNFKDEEFHKENIVGKFIETIKSKGFNRDDIFNYLIHIEKTVSAHIVFKEGAEGTEIHLVTKDKGSDDFIYCDVLGFIENRDFYDCYISLKNNSDEFFAAYEKQLSENQRKLDTVLSKKKSPNASPSREEILCTSAVKRTEEILDNLRKKFSKGSIARKALGYCNEKYSGYDFMNFDLFTTAFSLMDPRQNPDSDWQTFINFSEIAAGNVPAMVELKANNHNAYMAEFRKYFHREKFIDKIVDATSTNYYLSAYKDVFSEAQKCFLEGHFIATTYILTPQVEGLLKIWAKLKGIEFENPLTGISYIADKINEKEERDFFEYLYYRCVFPETRNPMEHGNPVVVNEETAMDAIMNVYYLITHIDDKDWSYKKITDFLRQWENTCNGENADSKILAEFILKELDISSWFNEANATWITDLFCDKFNDLLGWYKLNEAKDNLVSFINSDEFLSNVFDANTDIPLQIPDAEQEDEIRFNDGVVKYIKTIRLLNKECGFAFNETWLNKFEDFNNRLHDEKEKFHKAILDGCSQYAKDNN